MSISIDRKIGINRYAFNTFDFFTEMHVCASWNGVASAEKHYESPSFDQKEPLQKTHSTRLNYFYPRGQVSQVQLN